MLSSCPTPRSAALLLALVSSAFAAEPRYDVLDLRTLGFYHASNLNNLGHVIGYEVGGPEPQPGAYLLWNGSTVARNKIPVSGEITAFNDFGDLAGDSWDSALMRNRGWAVVDGHFQEFADAFAVTALNNQRQIAFNSHSGGATIFQGSAHTNLGSLSGPSTGVRAINTAGWAVGASAITSADQPQHAYLYRDGAMADLGTLGGDRSWASDINDAGNIVGTASDSKGIFRALLHTAGRTLPLSPADADSSAARINNYNVVVGDFQVGPGLSIWSGGVVTPLNDLVDFAGMGLAVVELMDFNDRGQLLVSAWAGWWDVHRTPFLLTPRALPPARLTALAARAIAGTNDQTSIAGFVLAGGSANGSVLLRTVGPGLVPLGVSNAATDPAITVFNSSNAVVATNDNWSADETNTATLSATAARLGAQPLAASSTDAALLADLSPGAYTAHASNPADPSRIVLTEIYDAGNEDSARLTAAAIRLQIGTGESIGIVGFALAGDGPAKVLLRALGPALAERGVSNILADPQLWLYRGNQPVMGNDDWGSAATTPLLASKTTQAGLPALADASKDAALLIQLEPGAYSVHVSGVDNTTGVSLVEVYLVSEDTP